ncbi:hypothetical protein JG486_31010 (plasmid) [Bacillus mycoides]|nr:hypothetical protein JG486_31010 [Bacillus mycoides]
MKSEEKSFSFFEGCKNIFIMMITFWLLIVLFYSEYLTLKIIAGNIGVFLCNIA